MKLFTIGDSISQGFMSGAAAKTDLAYSTIIARNLGVTNYNIPCWGKDGFPVNLESLFRRLEKRLGSDIFGPIEWSQAISIINSYLDETEDYYERGEGRFRDNYNEDPFHNVSVRGFDIAYSWLVTSEVCNEIVTKKIASDAWWGFADHSLLRTAHRVLQPNHVQLPQDRNSQLDWLGYHHQKEGVENLVLWLGANNALSTILELKIKQTSEDGTLFSHKAPDKWTYQERIDKSWNLWHPGDFEVEYQFMMDKVINIMMNNPHNVDFKIFVGTVPMVTIAPLIKVAGEKTDTIKVSEWPVNQKILNPSDLNELCEGVEREYEYGRYYPFFFQADTFQISDNHLNQIEVLHIDNTIREYNRIIQRQVVRANKLLGASRIYIVDIGTKLSDMAYKRNARNPKYQFPEYFRFIYPKIDTRYYGPDEDGNIKAGGVFSLDGVHPTAVGQGLIAWEFLKVMQTAGVAGANPDGLNWKEIFSKDTLRNQPLKIIQEIYDNQDIKRFLLKLARQKDWQNNKKGETSSFIA